MMLIIRISLLFAFIISFSTISNAQIVIKKRPARTKVVVVKPAKPSKNYVWIDGHWIVRGNKYVWVKGNWKKNKPGSKWIAGHWKKVPGGWKWVPGHWRVIQ